MIVIHLQPQHQAALLALQLLVLHQLAAQRLVHLVQLHLLLVVQQRLLLVRLVHHHQHHQPVVHHLLQVHHLLRLFQQIVILYLCQTPRQSRTWVLIISHKDSNNLYYSHSYRDSKKHTMEFKGQCMEFVRSHILSFM